MCQRRHGLRDPYEQCIVWGLQAIGFDVRLSTDREDEDEGFDVEDVKYGIRIDLYMGNGNNGRHAKKLAKASSGVHCLRIPANLVDDLWIARATKRVDKETKKLLLELGVLYFRVLRSAGAFRRTA